MGWRPSIMVTQSDRLLTILLYFFGISGVLAVAVVCMPMSWMGSAHRWLGLGDMPTGPVVEYLTRSLSAFYALFGAVLLTCSRSSTIPTACSPDGIVGRSLRRSLHRDRRGRRHAVVVVGDGGADDDRRRCAHVSSGSSGFREAVVCKRPAADFVPHGASFRQPAVAGKFAIQPSMVRRPSRPAARRGGHAGAGEAGVTADIRVPCPTLPRPAAAGDGCHQSLD